MTGGKMKYERLTVIDEKRDKNNTIHYLCKCECGNEKWIYRGNLISGKSKSCGCYRKEVLKKLYKKTNKYKHKKTYTIGITNNKCSEFKIDTEDYDKVKDICWYESKNGYIHHKDKRVMQMHRFLMNAPDGKVVDHINHDRKDNRKSNLRICTQKQNSNNRKVEALGITKINKNGNIYHIVQIKGKYIGGYKNYEEALKTRNHHFNVLSNNA